MLIIVSLNTLFASGKERVECIYTAESITKQNLQMGYQFSIKKEQNVGLNDK